MGKLSLATKLADELGSGIDEAMRFVSDVGMDTAQKTLDEATQAGSKTVEKWWKPATAIGGIGAGGALAWRQQEIEQARAIASQKRQYSNAAKSIMESDLSPEAKRTLLDQLNEANKASGNGGGGGGGGGLLGGDTQTTLILIIVMVFVLKFALGGDGE